VTEAHQGSQPGTLNVVAIDFGSTASTATWYEMLDNDHLSLELDPDQAEAVRQGVVDLLAEHWPEGLQEQFAAEALNIINRIDPEAAEGLSGPPHTRLIQVLGGEKPLVEIDTGIRRILDAVWTELARFILRSQPLQVWGDLRLDGIAAAAARTPAFTRNGLTKIRLDDGGSRTEIPSILRIPDNRIHEGELTSVRPVPESGVWFVRGVKRRLPAPAPLPDGFGPGNSDQLIVQVYRDLIKRVLRHTGSLSSSENLRFHHGVITYPTTMTPNVRDRLERLVKEAGVKRVTMRFDESVAALMYTMMREVGGDLEFGIESFRSRCRALPDGTWRKNLLVIDIGGGTTDIALTALRLRDLTASRRERNTGPRTTGLVYELSPEVLGATGHPQYGGDLLTLRVFYWIKAVLVDALRAKNPADDVLPPDPPVRDGESLARLVVNHGTPAPAPVAVREYLRKAVPTQSVVPDENAPDRRHTFTYGAQLSASFEALWALAEKMKRELADSTKSHVEMPFGDLSEFAESLGGSPVGKAIGELLPDEVRLPRADFLRLSRQVLTPAIDLAVDLARRRLSAEEGEPLDGVALTGRAAGMPLVRELVLERLSKAFEDLEGNSALVSVERDHPKQAASIGACWAQVHYENNDGAYDHRKIDGTLLESGRNQLVIDVHNLILNVPCDFKRGTAGAEAIPLIEHGAPFDRSDRYGRRSAGSGWKPAPLDIRVLRFLDTHNNVEWGRYNYEDHNGRDRPEHLYFEVEIGEDLMPLLHLCVGGKPHHALEGSSIPLPRDIPRPGGVLRSLPYDIRVVSHDRNSGGQTRHLVFPAGEFSAESFDSVFRPVQSERTPGGEDRLIRGMIAAVPLPRPRPSSETAHLTFVLTEPGDPEGGRVRPIDDVANPSLREGDEEIVPLSWAVLDETGTIHIEPGYPRYVQAPDAETMEREAGAVYTTRMDDPQPAWRSDWDPFTGEH